MPVGAEKDHLVFVHGVAVGVRADYAATGRGCERWGWQAGRRATAAGASAAGHRNRELEPEPEPALRGAEPEPEIIGMRPELDADAPTELLLRSGTRNVAPHCGHLPRLPAC